jgi:putative membrane protein
MNRLLLRWLINAIGLYLAARLVPGIYFEGNVGVLLVVALIFGLVNALLSPLLKLLTCPLIILTLGLFTLVINAAMLWLVSVIAQALNLPYGVEGFWPAAFLGALVISLISVVASLVIGEERRKK